MNRLKQRNSGQAQLQRLQRLWRGAQQWMQQGLHRLRKLRKRNRRLLAIALVAVLLTSLFHPALADSVQAQTPNNYCHLPASAINQKEQLRQQASSGDAQAVSQYTDLLKQHAQIMATCRQQTWPQRQAVWVRLYPCDALPGVLEALLDRIVNRGYSHVYVETFYNGQVLLPSGQNPTVWPSVVRTPGTENYDLLAAAIAKGHERGLKVYAWMFTMNFGYSYAQNPTRQQALALNGAGQNTLSIPDHVSPAGETLSDELFIDPYSNQAQVDYYRLVQAVVQRKPDGILFDYIRYARGHGSASLASRVKDLWIYGSASQQALYNRALNNKGQALIRRFVTQGYITAGDIRAIDEQFPTEGEPMWQGRDTPQVFNPPLTPEERQAGLQLELWYLTVAHAYQGVVDFLSMAALPAQQQNIATGVVFFPGGNRRIGEGFDSRLQPWNQFPSSMEWHPMVYGICGNTGCITNEVQEVINQAPRGTRVEPVLAGSWGNTLNRPTLEAQMQSIRQTTPQISGLSHFAYSWQDPEFDRVRKYCRS